MFQEFLTVREVASFLHVAQKSIYKWISEQRLPAYRFGRAVRVRRDDLDHFIETSKEG